jgi:hypothetical protein
MRNLDTLLCHLSEGVSAVCKDATEAGGKHFSTCFVLVRVPTHSRPVVHLLGWLISTFIAPYDFDLPRVLCP